MWIRMDNKFDKLNQSQNIIHDLNISPNYEGIVRSYHSICQQRYQKQLEQYNKQFLREFYQQESFQSSAYAAMRYHRHFAITTLWPPLHTKKEIDYVLEKMFKLSKLQEKRLHELLKYNQS